MAKLGVTYIIRRRYQREGKPCWRNLQQLYSKISNDSQEALKRKFGKPYLKSTKRRNNFNDPSPFFFFTRLDDLFRHFGLGIIRMIVFPRRAIMHDDIKKSVKSDDVLKFVQQ
ncbi:uncharacterized protein PADG_11596 [Paracoccidioides brasiliensis Pb18]|uniref:Uncharacterized protein n=1 Tax=Paracoccidioides brasiliensis (strain Pb18) TaxID=502780 RepID=A0A0A0HYF0_PARBD|nr:uncharacterized protein PADG_11596 [Paracoccidioides brasiliensis Pb18]KGM92395.1 hypothetical protein PADG_11596 [Paracoccidioides brasiliensis Pb18]